MYIFIILECKNKLDFIYILIIIERLVPSSKGEVILLLYKLTELIEIFRLIMIDVVNSNIIRILTEFIIWNKPADIECNLYRIIIIIKLSNISCCVNYVLLEILCCCYWSENFLAIILVLPLCI